MNILLIGLSHDYQLQGHASGWKKFKSYLIGLCLKERPDLIAEELNEDALKKWKADDSVARTTAKRLKTEHLFCDPDSQQRKKLGIKSRKEIAHELGYGRVLTRQQSLQVDSIEKTHWKNRERFWLERLMDRKFKKCIFILGADHVDHFSDLLIANGIQSVIIEKDLKL